MCFFLREHLLWLICGGSSVPVICQHTVMYPLFESIHIIAHVVMISSLKYQALKLNSLWIHVAFILCSCSASCGITFLVLEARSFSNFLSSFYVFNLSNQMFLSVMSFLRFGSFEKSKSTYFNISLETFFFNMHPAAYLIFLVRNFNHNGSFHFVPFQIHPEFTCFDV